MSTSGSIDSDNAEKPAIWHGLSDRPSDEQTLYYEIGEKSVPTTSVASLYTNCDNQKQQGCCRGKGASICCLIVSVILMVIIVALVKGSDEGVKVGIAEGQDDDQVKFSSQQEDKDVEDDVADEGDDIDEEEEDDDDDEQLDDEPGYDDAQDDVDIGDSVEASAKEEEQVSVSEEEEKEEEGTSDEDGLMITQAAGSPQKDGGIVSRISGLFRRSRALLGGGLFGLGVCLYVFLHNGGPDVVVEKLVIVIEDATSISNVERLPFEPLLVVTVINLVNVVMSHFFMPDISRQFSLRSAFSKFVAQVANILVVLHASGWDFPLVWLDSIISIARFYYCFSYALFFLRSFDPPSSWLGTMAISVLFLIPLYGAVTFALGNSYLFLDSREYYVYQFFGLNPQTNKLLHRMPILILDEPFFTLVLISLDKANEFSIHLLAAVVWDLVRLVPFLYRFFSELKNMLF